MNWLPSTEQIHRDIYKMKLANLNGYSLIRIHQTDVLMDRNDRLQNLKTAIDQINANDVVENIYIAKEGLYSKHIFCYF
jgi:hypothetical protein